MNPLLRLHSMLSDFQQVFKYSANFNHFCTYVIGLINSPHRGTMTQIYQSTKPDSTYWTLPKFILRSKWCLDKLTSDLTQQVQKTFSKGVYVYDETKSINAGARQYGVHFFFNNRYNKRNKNQSKFHHGHEFGAIGWVCETPQGTRLFPLAARVMYPGNKEDNSLAVIKHICGNVPPGLIVFDRGYNRRKVFTTILLQGHHLLCRAKSNAVFCYIPKPQKPSKPGRPRRYGGRVHLPYLKYRDIQLDNNTFSVADKVVRTRMCPCDVRLVVIRKRPKKSEPYRYSCLFTSDLGIPVDELIQHYKNRWQIETAFRDSKQNFGFDTYQLKNRKSLNRHVQLSFVAACLTQLCFIDTTADGTSKTENTMPDVDTVLSTLGIHWYKPKNLTRGLMVAYLQRCLQLQYFSAGYEQIQNSKKNLKTVEDST